MGTKQSTEKSSSETFRYERVVASASSKVLISGAYLIIDPANEGVVLSTDAQFHATLTSSMAT